MFIRRNQAFDVPSRRGGISPMSFDRHLVANLLVSVYSGVLEEPLPDRLAHLVRALETRRPQDLRGR
ncbi:MAG TPA: hypothetical protein VF601_03195 [Beijerinckiaceae bacterium]|jgi:hypothetical protein